MTSIGSQWKVQTKNAKKTISLKTYLLLHFLSNLLQIFTESLFYYILKILNAGFFFISS